MTVGPVEIEHDVRLKGGERQIYHRTPEFSEFIKEIENGLEYLFQTENPVYIFTSSGTGMMEAAITNTMCKGDEVIMVVRDKWGLKWEEMAKGYGLRCNAIKVRMDERVDCEKLRKMITDNVKGVFVTANETSIGILTNIKAIGEVVKDTQAILIVDAISSLGADELKTDEWNCDIVIASSQKALGLPPGLAFMSVSKKAWKFVEKSTLPKYYFDLKEYDMDIHRDQTPFTPAISLLYQLSERLKKIKEKKLENVIARHAYLSKILRAGIGALGLGFVGKNMSNGITGVFSPERINAKDIADILREKHNIEIAPLPGELEKIVFRVGVFGDLEESDIIKFLRALELTLDELGYKIEFGKSIKAAKRIFKEKDTARR